MYTQAALFYCISFLTSKAWTKNCTGKLIAKHICIPNEYTNQVSDSFPNPAEVFVDLQRVKLLDINPKNKKISVHIDFYMKWFDNRLELLNYNISDRFRADDAVNLWIPNYRIKRYVYSWNTFVDLAFITREFFIYSLINLKIYPLLGYGEVVYWVEKNNNDNNTAIFLYFEFRADVFCKMKLESFPFDKQTCFLEVLPTFTFYLKVFNSQNLRKYS